MPHINLHITGKVQGVFYRDSAKRKAQALGITGFVRNQLDGSVYAEAEGNQAALDTFVAWCHVGPPAAKVDGVKVHEAAMVGFTDFQIRR